MKMVDLRTKYMGLELKNPIVPSASPLSHSVDNIRKMRDAGASAVVLFSLFEEQLRAEVARLREILPVDILAALDAARERTP